MSKSKFMTNEKGRYELRFDGMGELIDFLNANVEKDNYSVTGHKKERDWDLGVGYHKAIEMAQTGWKDGLKKVSVMTNEISSQVSYTQVAYEWDDEGVTFDCAEYLTGSPEHWLRETPSNPKRIIRILVNSTFSAGISSDEILRRGAAVVSLIDTLQNDPANIIELDLVVNLEPGGCLKAPTRFYVRLGTTPIDIDSIAFALGHPAFFRRFGFAVLEVTNDMKHCGGYGSVQDPMDVVGEYQLYMECGHLYRQSHFASIENCIKWVEAQAKRLTAEEIEVFDE